MRILLVTNVLVSAFATRGLCTDLLRNVLSEQDLVVGEVVLDELRRILSERFRLPSDTIAAIEALLREHTVASAVAAEADLLVTGDAELLAVERPPLPIVNPRGLWERFRSGDPSH